MVIISNVLQAVIRRLNKFYSILNFSELRMLNKTDILLFCGDNNRGIIFSGKKYAQLLDSLNEAYQHKGLTTTTIAKPFSEIKGESAFGNVTLINGAFLRAYYGDRLLKKLGNINRGNGKFLVKLWSAIIAKTRPIIIIGIQPPPELCIAAKARKIEIFDLQHGIISDARYYSRDYRREFNNLGWPDCILCWDQQSKEWIENNIIDKTKARIIGNPWYLRFKYPRSDDALVSSFNTDFKISRNENPIILVTLQWGNEEDALGMSESLQTYIKEAGGSFIWWIRIHPVQMQDKTRSNITKKLEAEFKGRDNVKWKECSEMPLPVVLDNIDLHITSHSAVTIEAGWYGIKTALLNGRKELLYVYFGQQIKTGQAEIVKDSPDEIGNWIASNLNNIDKMEAEIDIQMMDNFVSEIQERKRDLLG